MKVIEEGKTCTKCGEWKPYIEFPKRKQNKKDGHETRCKMCIKEYKKQYRQKNIEQLKESKKQYQKENAKKIKDYLKQYYQKNAERLKKNMKQYRQENDEQKRENDKRYNQENAERINKQRKQYRQDNKEQIKERNKQYYQENAERINKQSRQYYQGNIEHFKKYGKRYYQENIEVIRERAKQYRQSEKGKEVEYKGRLKRRSNKNHVRFTPHERQQILERDKWQCQSCGIKVHDRSSGDWNTPNKAHIDHIIPISKGGDSEPNNLQTLCRTCNLSKQDKIELQLSLL